MEPSPLQASLKLSQIIEFENVEGIKDLKLLQSMISKRFTGKTEELNSFLDQINNAYLLCDSKLHHILLILFFSAIKGKPRKKLHEHPEVDTYQKLREFLHQHYENRESFSQCYNKLSAAKQFPHETVQQYGDRLTNLAYLAKLAAKKEQKIINEATLLDGKIVTVKKEVGLSSEAAT